MKPVELNGEWEWSICSNLQKLYYLEKGETGLWELIIERS